MPMLTLEDCWAAWITSKAFDLMEAPDTLICMRLLADALGRVFLNNWGRVFFFAVCSNNG